MFLYDDIVHCILSDTLMSYLAVIHDSIITNDMTLSNLVYLFMLIYTCWIFREVLFFDIYLLFKIVFRPPRKFPTFPFWISSLDERCYSNLGDIWDAWASDNLASFGSHVHGKFSLLQVCVLRLAHLFSLFMSWNLIVG